MTASPDSPTKRSQLPSRNEPEARRKQLLDLSNELLSRVVPFLDPPTTVLLGLTCKHLLNIVTSLCQTDLMSIVPKYLGSAKPPAILEPYIPTEEESFMMFCAKGALSLCWQIGFDRFYKDTRVFSFEFLKVLSRLDYAPNDRIGHWCFGHHHVHLGDDVPCAFCTMTMSLKWSYNAGRNQGKSDLVAVVREEWKVPREPGGGEGMGSLDSVPGKDIMSDGRKRSLETAFCITDEVNSMILNAADNGFAEKDDAGSDGSVKEDDEDTISDADDSDDEYEESSSTVNEGEGNADAEDEAGSTDNADDQ